MFKILNTINISLFEMQYIVLVDIILSTGNCRVINLFDGVSIVVKLFLCIQIMYGVIFLFLLNLMTIIINNEIEVLNIMTKDMKYAHIHPELFNLLCRNLLMQF